MKRPPDKCNSMFPHVFARSIPESRAPPGMERRRQPNAAYAMPGAP
jgi:hypothetical protein